ncbi:MAG TPA: YqhA family protein [Xanthobacteraceae bacterium]|nr:YqhA family protein [Xanthobacteraceae bacterium]
MRRSERGFEAAIFLSRWLIAPFLVGLFCSLVLLLYRFVVDFYALALQLPRLPWHDLAVGVLNLIDVSLVANLILIVIFSAYDNFIRKIDPADHPDWPAGLIVVDYGALKQKLMGSIVIIAAVDALAWYLDLEKEPDAAKLGWALGFPLMFVVAMLMLAAADRLGRGANDKAD